MINILPPEEKEKLLFEEKTKLIIILGTTILIPLICLILLLLSIRLHVLGEENFQAINLEQAKKKYQTPDFLTFKDIIQKNNTIVVQLASFYKKEVYFTKALKIISSISRPQKLYLTNISLTRTENQKISVTASGFSESREDLLAFQKSIEENKEIQKIYFSPESWINSKNVTFHLTFEISK